MKIILNFALTADGKIGTKQKNASPFTSKQDLDRLLTIRTQADAIMVGRGTLEADQMSMTIPEQYQPSSQPLRLIISRAGVFNYDHKIFHTTGGSIHLLSTEAPFHKFAPDHVIQHRTSLATFLKKCEQDLKIQTLLCEGGGELVRTLVEMNRVDEINLTWAGHSLIGGQLSSTILGAANQNFLKISQSFELTYFEPTSAGECFLRYTLKK